jgi:hypothetical protein
VGCIVGKDGVRVDPKKIKSMQDCSCPKTIKSMYGFLGLTGYYHMFVQNYGKIVAPLTALPKKNDFTWNPTTDQSFQELKDVMYTTSILALPKFTKTFFLECDASGKRIGAVLMQEARPLAFTRKELLDRNLRQSIYGKEMLVFFHDVDIWHPYLLGKHF